MKLCRILDAWFPDEINEGQTEKLFFLLGGLMLVDFIIFLLVARWYKYRDPTPAAEKDPKILEEAEGKGSTTVYPELPPPYEEVNPAFMPDAEVTKL